MKEKLVKIAGSLKGIVTKERPLFLHMHSRSRDYETFEIGVVTDKGIKVTPPGREEQTYRVGMEKHSYNVFLNREDGTLHCTVYEGKPAPPVRLAEGQWLDEDPQDTSEFITKRSSYLAIADLMNVEEGTPTIVWILAVLCGLAIALPNIMRFFG